jgi:hypothetical protein
MPAFPSDRFAQFFIALFIVASLVAVREALTYDDVRLAAEAFVGLFAVPLATYGMVAGADRLGRTTRHITHRLDSLLDARSGADAPRLHGRPAEEPTPAADEEPPL